MIKSFSSTRFYQIFLVQLLSVSLILSPVITYASVDHGGGKSESGEVSNTSSKDPEYTNQDQIDQLRKEVLGTSATHPSSLDPFMMVRQQVVDPRRDKIDALKEQEAIDNYTQKKAHYEQKIKEYQGSIEDSKKIIAIFDQTVDSTDLENSNDAVVGKKRSVLVSMQKTLETKLAISQMYLEETLDNHPSESKQALHSFIDQELSTRHHFTFDKVINIKNNSGNIVEVLNEKDFKDSLSPSFSSPEMVSLEDTASFEITKPDGEVLHNFDVPVSFVTFFGKFLVFYEKDSIFYDNYSTLKFIDLKYAASNIGNAPLPVFSLPLNSKNEPKSVRVEGQKLIVDDIKLTLDQLDVLSKSNQVILNTNIALVDPASQEGAVELIGEIHEFYQKSMKSQSELMNSQVNEALRTEDLIKKETDRLHALSGATDDKREQLKKVVATSLEDGKITDDEHTLLNSALNMKTPLTETNQALFNGRRVTTRLKMLWQYLKHPRPEGTPALQASLLAVATAKTSKDRGASWKHVQESLAYRMLKFGSIAFAATLGASVLHPTAQAIMYQSLDLISATHAHYMGYLSHIDYGKNYGDLSVDATITSTTGVAHVYPNYIEDGRWPKFLWGLVSVLKIPLFAFGVIHIASNTVNILGSLKKSRNSLSEDQKTWINALHRAATKNKETFDKQRAEAERKISGSDVLNISPEDVDILEQHIKQLNADEKDRLNLRELNYKSNNPSRLQRMKSTLAKQLGIFKPLRTLSAKVYENSKDILYNGKYFSGLRNLISSVASNNLFDNSRIAISALRQFYLSQASLRTLFKTGAQIWNFFFVPRSFALNPKMWAMPLVYPMFFQETTKDLSSQRFPSTYNPGLNGWLLKLKLAASKMNPIDVTENRVLSKVLYSKPSLYQLRRFEVLTKNAEPRIIKLAVKKAQSALLESLEDPDKILAIFDSAQLNGKVSTGVINLYDKKLKKQLTVKERSYFRLVFTRTYESLMKDYWSEVIKTNNLEISEEDAEAIKDFGPTRTGTKLQNAIRKGDVKIKTFSSEESNSILDKIIGELNMAPITKWAKEKAFAIISPTRAKNNFRHYPLTKLNPANMALGRYNTVKTRVKSNPNAIERATRSELAALKVSLPLGVLSAMVIYAGVDSGVLQPFNPDGLDTETHLNYYSRMLFYSGFIPGVIMNLMGGTWLKILSDARIDDLKGFDSAATFHDQQKGFWRFQLKNLMKHPDNKWMQNQIYNLQIILSNMSAAATTILVTQLWGLGRIDVGMFLATYAIIFITPLAGVALKIDQSFELSKAWVSSRIPTKLRAHPKAQDYISNSLQKKRMLFSVFEQAFGIVILENVAGDMLTIKDNVRQGSRAFLRLIFGGDTPTILIDKGLESLKGLTSKIPGTETLIEKTQSLFTNKYESFERFPERITKLGTEGVNRLIEDPSLPKNALGEFLGKTMAAVTSLGSFSLLPYFISDRFNKRNEKKRLNSGEAALEELNSKRAAIQNLAPTESGSHTTSATLTCNSVLSNN